MTLVTWRSEERLCTSNKSKRVSVLLRPTRAEQMFHFTINLFLVQSNAALFWSSSSFTWKVQQHTVNAVARQSNRINHQSSNESCKLDKDSSRTFDDTVDMYVLYHIFLETPNNTE